MRLCAYVWTHGSSSCSPLLHVGSYHLVTNLLKAKDFPVNDVFNAENPCKFLFVCSIYSRFYFAGSFMHSYKLPKHSKISYVQVHTTLYSYKIHKPNKVSSCCCTSAFIWVLLICCVVHDFTVCIKLYWQVDVLVCPLST